MIDLKELKRLAEVSIKDCKMFEHTPRRLFNENVTPQLILQLIKEHQEMREALESILSNVALDWYVQQFAKDETPRLGASGIAAKIHNIETLQRIKISFEIARQTLDGVSK